MAPPLRLTQIPGRELAELDLEEGGGVQSHSVFRAICHFGLRGQCGVSKTILVEGKLGWSCPLGRSTDLPQKVIACIIGKSRSESGAPQLPITEAFSRTCHTMQKQATVNRKRAEQRGLQVCSPKLLRHPSFHAMHPLL